MELQDWRKEPGKKYSNEFKLRMVELALQPGACVAQIARESGVNENVIFKWLRLWQNEGRKAAPLRIKKRRALTGFYLVTTYKEDHQKIPVLFRPFGPEQSCFNTWLL